MTGNASISAPAQCAKTAYRISFLLASTNDIWALCLDCDGKHSLCAGALLACLIHLIPFVFFLHFKLEEQPGEQMFRCHCIELGCLMGKNWREVRSLIRISFNSVEWSYANVSRDAHTPIMCWFATWVFSWTQVWCLKFRWQFWPGEPVGTLPGYEGSLSQRFTLWLHPGWTAAMHTTWGYPWRQPENYKASMLLDKRRFHHATGWLPWFFNFYHSRWELLLRETF